jgi:hypothetical protein
MFVFAAGGARWSSAAWAQTDTHELLKLFFTSLIAIILATTEEILFRALAFKYLLTSTTTWAVVRAMVLSSIIFALAHRFDDPLSWLELRFVGLLIELFLLGCLLALVYYEQFTGLLDRRALRAHLDCAGQKDPDHPGGAVRLGHQQFLRSAHGTGGVDPVYSPDNPILEPAALAEKDI